MRLALSELTDDSAIRGNESPLTSWQDKSDELMKHLIAALVSACLEVTITTCAWTYLSSATAAPLRCTFTLDREAIASDV